MRLSTSSRLKPNVICVRSLVPKLKKSASSAISSAHSAARGVSIIVPMVMSGLFFMPFSASSISACTQLRASASSSRVTVSGIITSTIGFLPFLRSTAAAASSALTCMAYRPGLTTPRRTPRVPIIGLCSAQSSAALSSWSSRADRPVVACLIRSSSTDGRNSCSGGSSSRIVTGRPSIASRISSKSICCTRPSSAIDAASSATVSARIISHDRQAIGRQEHVLGAAQADALGAELRGRWPRLRRYRRWRARPACPCEPDRPIRGSS